MPSEVLLSATVRTASHLVLPGVFGAHRGDCDTFGGETANLQSTERIVREGWLKLGLASQSPGWGKREGGRGRVALGNPVVSRGTEVRATR